MTGTEPTVDQIFHSEVNGGQNSQVAKKVEVLLKLNVMLQ